MSKNSNLDDEAGKGHFLQDIREKVYARLNRLLNQNRLMESTYIKYKRIIDNYLAEYDEINKHNIDKFLSTYKSYYAFYALKHLLIAADMYNLYNELEKPRQLERKVKRPRLSFDETLSRISRIEDDKLRLIAVIQFLTAKRAKEVILLKKEDIEFKDNSISFVFTLKGGRQDIKEVDKDIFGEKNYDSLHELWQNTLGSKYIFMPENIVFNTYYKRYLDALKEQGLKTHDLRSIMATLIYEKTKNILLVKEVLKHANIKHTLRYIKDDTSKLAEKPANVVLS